MIDKCNNCPVDCDKPCFAQRVNHRGFCDKIEPDKLGYNPKYIELVKHLSCGDAYKQASYVKITDSEGKDVQVKVIQDEEEKSYPSLLQMGKNLTHSAINFTKSGFKLASDDKINRRLAICSDCKLFDEKAERCTNCGCFVKVKARIDSDVCPVGRWEMSDEQLLADANSKTRKDEGLYRLNNSVITHPAEPGGTCCGA